MLAKRRSCNESVTRPRILVSTTIRRTWWVFIDMKIILLLTFLTSLNLHRRYIIYYRRLLLCWPYRDLPARDTRYQSAVRFQEQSWFYLPRFTWIWGGRREATAGSPVVYRDESKVEGSKGSASRYLVSFAISAYTSPWWSVPWWKVLFRSEQCSATIATGNDLFWDSESRKWFLSILSFRFQSPI